MKVDINTLLKMNLVFVTVLVIGVFHEVVSRCPSKLVLEKIEPCVCSEQNGEGPIVTCMEDIDLPSLTTILRQHLCGQHLKRFELMNSNVGYLPSNLFYKLTVEDIRVSFTNISHFTKAGRSAFYGLEKSLKFLSMRHCYLVDELQWQKIGELDALQSLDLVDNQLTTIPRQWFHHPPRNIKFLYLSKNRISILQPGALSAMNNLVILDLSENFITALERNMLPYPGNTLTILRLSYNDLTSLPEDFFDEMLGLRRLYIDNNRLTALHETVWAPIWGELSVLDVMGNNLNCTCSSRWLSTSYPVEHLYGSCSFDTTTTTDHTTNLLNKELKDLLPWDFDFCDTETTSQP